MDCAAVPTMIWSTMKSSPPLTARLGHDGKNWRVIIERLSPTDSEEVNASPDEVPVTDPYSARDSIGEGKAGGHVPESNQE